MTEPEIFQELWLMTGTEKDFEIIETFLQEMDFSYEINTHLIPGETFRVITLKKGSDI